MIFSECTMIYNYGPRHFSYMVQLADMFLLIEIIDFFMTKIKTKYLLYLEELKVHGSYMIILYCYYESNIYID